MRLRPSESDSDERLAAGVSPGPKPRRGVLKLAGIGLLVVALIAGLVVYLHLHAQATARARAREAAAERDAAAKAAAAQRVQDVKQAFLDYFAGLTRMDIQASLTPLEPFLTAAGLQDEQSEFQQIQSSGYRYNLSADHDLQIVVYAGNQLASVDDNMLRHLTPLDPTTLSPTDKEQVLPIHASYGMRRQGGRWLVDSVVTFGSDGSEPSFGVSYVAISRNKPVESSLRSQIEQAYIANWEASDQAYENLDAAPLQRVELPPALDKDLSVLGDDKRVNHELISRVEHNYRIAVKDTQTAYVYDSFADFSYVVDASTKKAVSEPLNIITRETYELKKVGGTWKVDLIALNEAK